MVPMTRCTWARCQGDRGADRTSLIPLGLHILPKLTAENAIAIPQEVPGNLLKRESLAQLLGGPLGGGMRGHVEMDDAPTLVS